MRTLRKGTLEFKLVVVVCGAAFKNKGVQQLLDAVVNYLPSPIDIPPVKGINPDNDKEEERKADDDAPFAALAFKIINDPFVGQLTFMRVYSGQLNSGTCVLNSTKDKRERIGRLLLMHANKREEIKEIQAGNICAAVGLKTAHTGDTLCDEKHPIVLERMEFPEPVISVAIEPKTKAEQQKLGEALQKLSTEDPSFRAHTDEETGQTIISGMGELHLEIIVDRMKREYKVDCNVGKPEVAYRESIRNTVKQEGRYIKQSGGHGMYGHVWIEVGPSEPGAGYVFENDIVGGVIPKEFIGSIEKGIREAMQRGVHGRLPGHRREGVAVRRQLPRRRLVGSGVRGRGVDGVPGRGAQGRHPPARAGDGGRGRRARGLHGRRDRRPERAPRPHHRHEPAQQHAGRDRGSAARDDVRLLDRPAQQDAGPSDLHDAVPPLRASSQQHRRRNRRQGQGRVKSLKRDADLLVRSS